MVVKFKWFEELVGGEEMELIREGYFLLGVIYWNILLFICYIIYS